MTDIATYRINYRLDDWERIAAERGELCAPIGAVRAVNALCDEVESLRQQVREQQGEPVAEVSAEKGLTYGGRPEQPIGTLFYTAPTIPEGITQTPEMRELLLRPDKFTAEEMRIILLSAAPKGAQP